MSEDADTSEYREYGMSYRGPGFLAVIWYGSSPFPNSLGNKLALFLSLPVCRGLNLLTGAEGVGAEPNHTITRRPGPL